MLCTCHRPTIHKSTCHHVSTYVAWDSPLLRLALRSVASSALCCDSPQLVGCAARICTLGLRHVASHIKTQHFLPSSGASLTKPVAFLLIFDSLFGAGLISIFGGASMSCSSEAGSAESGSAAFRFSSDLCDISLMMISIGGSSFPINWSSGLTHATHTGHSPYICSPLHLFFN